MIGIYCIRNKVNDKCYIGQAIDIETRWKQHRKMIGHKNKVLYQAFRKYGIDQFEFSVLEECDIDQLNDREVYWIDKYDSFKNGYNCTIGGDGNNQGKNSYSDEYQEEYQKQYRDDHKNERNEYKKQYYNNHKNEQKEYWKQYQQAHKDEIKEYQKQYRDDHKEYKKQYQQAHKNERNEYMRQYRLLHKMKALPDEVPLW